MISKISQDIVSTWNYVVCGRTGDITMFKVYITISQYRFGQLRVSIATSLHRSQIKPSCNVNRIMEIQGTSNFSRYYKQQNNLQLYRQIRRLLDYKLTIQKKRFLTSAGRMHGFSSSATLGMFSAGETLLSIDIRLVLVLKIKTNMKLCFQICIYVHICIQCNTAQLVGFY